MSRVERLLREALRLTRPERTRLVFELTRSLEASGGPASLPEVELAAVVCTHVGRLAEARSLLDQAKSEATAATPQQRCRLARLEAEVAMRGGAHGRAFTCLDEALDWARGDPVSEAAVQLEIGALASKRGQRDEEIARTRHALDRFRELGEGWHVAEAAVCLGFALHESGQLDAADAAYDEALDRSEACGHESAAARGMLYRGWLDLERGREERGVAALESARGRARALERPRYAAAASYCLAQAFTRQGDAPRALHAVKVGRSDAAGLEDRAVAGLLHLAEGQAWVEAGDLTPAQRAFDAAQEAFEVAADATDLRRSAVELSRGLIDVRQGAWQRARARGRQVQARFEGALPSSDLRWSWARLHAALVEAARKNPVLLIGADGEGFVSPEDPERVVDLRRRGPQRGILRALARAPAALSWPELLRAGWADEKMDAEAGHRRVRTAIWGLRRSGLGRIVQTTDAGYRLAPGVEVRWVDFDEL